MSLWDAIKNLQFKARRAADELLIEASYALKWSSLATIGRSPMVRLTILAPFVGYLLLFNAHIHDWLSLSLDHLKQISGSAITDSEAVSSRLNFLYFGLVFIGFASTLFAVFAPEEIKRNHLAAEHIRANMEIATPIFTRATFQNVIRAFLHYNVGEKSSPFYADQSPSFPSRAADRLHDFIKTIFAETKFSEKEIENDIGIFMHSVMSRSGYFLSDALIEKLDANARVESHFIEKYFQTAVSMPKDIFYLEYISLDYSKFFVRMMVASLYGLGFALLLIPTVETAAKLFTNWLFA